MQPFHNNPYSRRQILPPELWIPAAPLELLGSLPQKKKKKGANKNNKIKY